MVFEECYDKLATALAERVASLAGLGTDRCVAEILGDIATLLYRHYALLLTCHSPRGPGWWVRVTGYLLRSWRYRRVNRYTRGNPVVSAVAAVMLARSVCKMVMRGRVRVGDVDSKLEDAVMAAIAAESAVGKLSAILSTVTGGGREAAPSQLGKEEQKNGIGGWRRSVSKYGSIVRFEPRVARERLELLNKMLLLLDIVANELSEERAVPTRQGFDDVGVARELEELDRIVLDEAWMLSFRHTRALLVNAGFSVYEGGAKCRIRVFLDKSGSMHGEPLSVGAAYALALLRVAEVEGYVFDTSLRRLSDDEILDAFLTVRADGGTVIDNALEEAARRDEPAVIVTDGLDKPRSKPSDNTLIVIVGDGGRVPDWAATHARLVVVDVKRPLEYIGVFEDELSRLLEDTC